jgi:hypothetical protein
MRLTATTIRTLSLPEGKVHKVFFDSDLPGFGLRHFSRAGETVAPSTDTQRTRCSGDPGFSVHQVQRDPSTIFTVLASAHVTVIPLSPPPRYLRQVQTDASVTIRPLILNPAQRVSHI